MYVRSAVLRSAPHLVFRVLHVPEEAVLRVYAVRADSNVTVTAPTPGPAECGTLLLRAAFEGALSSDYLLLRNPHAYLQSENRVSLKERSRIRNKRHTLAKDDARSFCTSPSRAISAFSIAQHASMNLQLLEEHFKSEKDGVRRRCLLQKVANDT